MLHEEERFLREENEKLKRENETLQQAIATAHAAGLWYYDYPVVKPVAEPQPSDLMVANTCLSMHRERYQF